MSRLASGKVARAVLVAALVGGCDHEASSGDRSAAAPSALPTASSVAPAAQEPPAIARPPAITIDDRTCAIDGATFPGAPAEWRERAAAALAKNPRVAGEAVVITVMRDTKVPRVLAMIDALAMAKAKSVVVRSPTRDQTTGELELAFHASPAAAAGAHDVAACSVVAMIEPNGTVAVWSKGGGGVSRFARGMAGPDLSTSGEAIRKRAASCDSPVWFVGALDTATWGLTFDLATRARGGAEAGATLRPIRTVLLGDAPTPGKALPPMAPL